jgi:uncharacterized membrane protein
METSIQTGEEDRILRTWTPLILRTILVLSTVILTAGVALTIVKAPGYYVERFSAIRQGHLHPSESIATLAAGLRTGDSHAITTVGLYVLTMVPLVRVAFTFILFLKERDFVYVAATAYVLAGLIAGMMLGRIG